MLKRPIRWTQRPSLRKGARQLSVPSAGWGPPSVRRRVAAGRPGSGRGVCAEGGAVPFAAPTPSAACWAETRHHRLFSLASRARSVPPVGALAGQPGGRRDRDALSTCRSCSAWGRQPPLRSALPEATSLSLLVAPAPTGQRSLPWGQRAGPSPGGPGRGPFLHSPRPPGSPFGSFGYSAPVYILSTKAPGRCLDSCVPDRPRWIWTSPTHRRVLLAALRGTQRPPWERPGARHPTELGAHAGVRARGGAFMGRGAPGAGIS